jgi:hypothetical protein
MKAERSPPLHLLADQVFQELHDTSVLQIV